MTIQQIKQGEEILRKIKDIQSVIDAITDKEGKPKTTDGKLGELLSKLFTEFRNVSSQSYKERLATVAFDAIVAATREDIEKLENEFREL